MAMRADGGLKRFKEAVAAGRPFLAASLTDDLEVPAGVLRNMLLQKAAGRGALTYAGIHIVGTIAGSSRPRVSIVPDAGTDVIDLGDLASADANPLPALSLIGCWIKAPLVLRGSHFARLTIDNCLIEQIDADHVVVDNSFQLKYLRAASTAPGARAQIRLVGARVAGHVDLRGSRLIASALTTSAQPLPDWPDIAEDRPSGNWANRYALSLSSAQIGGRLIFDKGFSAVGGVSLYQAVVAGSILIKEAQFESVNPHVPAIDAEELRVEGTLLWRPFERGNGKRPSDWHVAGSVILKRARIAGDLVFAGCRWADVGAVSLRDEGGPVNHIMGWIDLRLARVGGQLEFLDGCHIMRRGDVPKRKQYDNVDRRLFGPSVDAWKIDVGNGVRIAPDCRFFGPLFFGNSIIGNGFAFAGSIEFDLSGATIQRYPEGLDLTDARIQGLVRLDGRIGGVISLRRSRVEGGVHLRDLTIAAGVLSLGDRVRDRDSGHATLLDFGELVVSGGVHLEKIRIEWRRGPQQWMRDLPRTRLGQHVHRKIERGGDLVTYQISHPQRMEIWEFDALFANGSVHIIDGSLQSFLPLAASRPTPDGPHSACDFLRLYSEHVRGQQGTAAIVDFGAVSRVNKKYWRFTEATMCSGNACYRSDIIIDVSQSPPRVIPFGDATIPMENPYPNAPYYLGPLRIGPVGNEETKIVTVAESEQSAIDVAFTRYFRPADGIPREFRPSHIDFRGLKCRAFDDMAGSAWNTTDKGLGPQHQWRLLLDGIDFEILGTSEPGRGSTTAERVLELQRRTAMLLSFCDIGAHARPFARHVTDTYSGLDKDRMEKAKTFPLGALVPLLRHAEMHPSFSPQPLETFAHAYFINGDRRAASRILKISQTIEWRRRAAPRNAPDESGWIARTFRRIEGKLVQWIGDFYGNRFGYGHSSRRALATLVMGLAACWIITAVNAWAGILVPLDRNLLESAIAEGCRYSGDNASGLFLYAFDSFVPLIDLHRECGFAIKAEAPYSQLGAFFDSAIMFSGWVISSLSIVTLTGLVRRFPRA
ncbi:MAG TPA: hypothetical protein VM760_07955 [Sphingomicrobium sp.]|nr:hypothetical protein [Sphingomicrobium sp.]